MEQDEVQAEGLIFWSANGEQIINYPKLHRSNGSAKNGDARTKGCYKHAVRVFKNARERVIVDDARLRLRYPSYFVECLLYNVPDDCFSSSYQSTFMGVVDHLDDALASSANDFFCQNEHQWLFGAGTYRWDVRDAIDFVGSMASLWNRW